MKTIQKFRYILAVVAALAFGSCSSDDGQSATDPLQGLRLATTLSNQAHSLELYTSSGTFETGYNAVYVKVKDNDNGTYVGNVPLSWNPVMQMSGMSHSCPASAVSPVEGQSAVYSGYIVFQMAGNAMEYWTLSLDYEIDGTAYQASAAIDVNPSARRRVESFQGTDGKNYVLALVEPSQPRVAINDMSAVLYTMESMMDFMPAAGYAIHIDPRMPGMGNHTSPNNESLVPSVGSDAYKGRLSLTMTGYWKINLRLADSAGTVVKGEPVTESNPSSSIFFEIEF